MPHTADTGDTPNRWWLAAALGFAAVSISVFLGSAPAGAIDCGGNGRVDDQGADIDALCSRRSPDSAPGSDWTAEDRWNAYCTDYENDNVTYAYEDGYDVTLHSWNILNETRVDQLGLNPTGVYGSFRTDCEHPTDPGQGGEFFYTITEPIPIDVLLDQVRERINIDDPPIDSNPSFSERFAVVRIPTWLWVDEEYWNQDNLEDEQGGFVEVEVWAEPVDLTWDFPDAGDHEIDCPDGPGTPWVSGADDPECSVLFRQSSAGQGGDAFQATATVTWEFYWTLNGADQGPLDDLLEVATDFEIQVGEIQSVES